MANGDAATFAAGRPDSGGVADEAAPSGRWRRTLMKRPRELWSRLSIEGGTRFALAGFGRGHCEQLRRPVAAVGHIQSYSKTKDDVPLQIFRDAGRAGERLRQEQE